MLDIKMLENMPECCIFATGYVDDTEDGLFIWGTGKKLRWVAVRGGVADWAIYCLEAGNSFNNPTIEHIADYGDKVCGEQNIKRLVPCDDEAFRRYRC